MQQVDLVFVNQDLLEINAWCVIPIYTEQIAICSVNNPPLAVEMESALTMEVALVTRLTKESPAVSAALIFMAQVAIQVLNFLLLLLI